ncbi:MAG: thioredoxin family protein [Bacteroidota bacterium]|nr:thioredoxin family protein [Bacteroidota bacterium]
MKKILFILPLLAMAISFCSMSPDKKVETANTPVTSTTDNSGVGRKITWVDFNEGYAKAKSEKKIALIDCYTDWCYWCKRLDKDTYTDSSIIGLVNSKYVAIKFNPEKTDVKYTIDGKTYNGMELLSILSNGQSSGYPTTFFINTKGNKMLAPFEGYAGPADFLKTLQERAGQ